MEKKSILTCPTRFDKTDLLHLVSLSAGYAIACQNRMGELVIGNSGWNADIKNRTISFGTSRFEIGILGSESHTEGTWLWGWANTESNLPELVTAPSRRAKKLLSDCAEFSAAKFALDELRTGHSLSMVCTGTSPDNVCYYRCPYDGGALFVQLEGLPEEVFSPLPPEALARQYLEIISSMYCDHRLLAAGFLWQNGTVFEESENCITAGDGEKTLRFDFEEFDGLSRVTNIGLG